MKLHRLEIEGFGPFLRRQVIDFDDYDADGLFLISGKTGAGKSSLLDAVCFALYASVPRYNSLGAKRVRSDHALAEDRTEVSLTFSTGNETYRVTRSPEYERPKQRGGGMTMQQAAVQLDRLDGEQWVGIASRAVDAGNHLAEILQLNKDQFLQVILLAQNRFAKFLLADSKERQTLLRTLFGTRRFEDYQRQLIERKKTSEQSVAAARARLLDRLSDAEKLVQTQGWGEVTPGTNGAAGSAGAGGSADEAGAEGSPGDGGAEGSAGDGAVEGSADEAGTEDWRGEDRVESSRAEGNAEVPVVDAALLPVAGRLEMLSRAQERGAYRVDATKDAVDRADQARTESAATAAETRGRRERQQRRDATREELTRLEAQVPAVSLRRTELAAAREAQRVATSIKTHARDLAAADAAAATVVAAQLAWAELIRDMRDETDTHDSADVASPKAPSVAQLRALIDEHTATVGSLAAANTTEQSLELLVQRLADATDALTHAETTRQSLRDEAQQIPQQLTKLEGELATLQTRADRLDDLTSGRATVQSQLEAAQQQAGLEHDRERALHSALEANRAARASADKLDALYQQKLAGSASELAATLVDGAECPVCGSASHPHPAPPLVDPVTDADLAAATAERDERQRAATEASEAEKQAAATVARVIAAAGGQSLEHLIEAEQTAQAEMAEAQTALTAHAEAQRLRDALRERELSMTQAIDAANDTVTAAVTAQAAAIEQLRSARELVAAAREGWASVAERLDSITVERDAAQTYVAAAEGAARADEAVASSQASLDAALAETSFETAALAQEASRTVEQMVELEAVVTEHDAAVRAAKATLMELELEVLPDEAIDVATAEVAAEAAQQEWARVTSELTALRGAVDALAERIGTAIAEQAAQQEALSAHETIERLADTVSGHEPNTKRMSLETFILAAELEEIVIAANVRLADMSSGRYRLQHSDERVGNASAGLGIDIFDSFTSKSRPAHSLSGGETFLASLALALGLAEVVTGRAGGVRLDTLFIDEGFGSLDPDTLEIAMQTLDELRSGGRTVGIISHVEAMKEQIPAQLRVSVAPDGSSDITAR